jgi:hypothetical protein
VKGLIISLAAFVLYVASATLVAHLTKPERHGRILFPFVLVWTPAYFLLFLLTPPDLGFLPPAWRCSLRWLDVSYGYVIFLLNCHSFIDFFYGFNGGFSTSLMQELHRAAPAGLPAPAIVGLYKRPDGTDAIYGWRLPQLERTGYIAVDRERGVCTLTPKGRAIARLARGCKRFLNLGSGG